MLKPIAQPFCCAALNACFDLQMHLLKWLCNPTTTAADITKTNLVPPRVPTQIEADWLWLFLYGRKQTRLQQAKIIASMSAAEKASLLGWGNSVVAIAAQFVPAPPAWPITLPAISAPAWTAFKNLMDAFYERGLRAGLPYQADGTPVAEKGVDYAYFVQAFRDAHRVSLDLDAREVCVLCGGHLGDTPHVDHWIIKSKVPLLSVCADNLQLACNTCNAAPNKGEKPVHTAGSFDAWFHPHLRPGTGLIRLDYVIPEMEVRCEATQPVDQPKVDNLNQLLNLADRWTREFKAEYFKQQSVLRGQEKRRVSSGQARHSLFEIRAYVQHWQDDLLPGEPHHEVHQALGTAILDPARLAAWHIELGSVS